MSIKNDIANNNIAEIKACSQSIVIPLESGRPAGVQHKRTTVLIVERSALLRHSLAQTVAAGFDCDVLCFERLSGVAESELAAATCVLVSLLSEDKQETLNELEALTAACPDARVMVLGKSEDPVEARLALGKGAKGYISARVSFELFILALKCVEAGGGYVSASCFDEGSRPPVAAVAANGITEREMEVIEAIRQGKPNKIIAYDLGVCEGTVKAHIRHIMKKLGSKNRTEIAIKGAALAASSGD